jgi:protein SCO1/2
VNVHARPGATRPRPAPSDARSPRIARAAARLGALAVAASVLAGCVTSTASLPTLRPLASGAGAAPSAAAGAGAAGTSQAATPAVTPPNPLGPGLGLPSAGAPLPSPVLIRPPAMAPPLWLYRADNGQLFDWHSVMGTPTIVYFGYTHCPDVCPASLGVIREAVAKAGVPVQVVFVTVDPDRDTPDVLKEYLGYFGQGWIGLSGGGATTLQAIELYGGRYQKLDAPASAAQGAGYAVGHTTEIYLVDQEGNWVETFPFGSSSDQVIQGLREVSASGS